MTCVRGFHLATLAIAIERQCVKLLILHPEASFNRLAQVFCDALPSNRSLLIASLPGQGAHAQECAPGVALHFYQCDGPNRGAAIAMKNGVMAVFPALIGQAGDFPSLVADKAFGILRGIGLHPERCQFQCRPKRFNERPIVGAFCISAGQHHEQGGRIDASVITGKG
ncbi:hypothetical protein D3C76_844310 [compost metagenome]